MPKAPKVARKDPSHPKRVTGSFFFFSNNQRPSIQAANPTLKNHKISILLGETWRGMDNEQKKPWVSLAAQDRARYRKEMLIYVPVEVFNITPAYLTAPTPVKRVKAPLSPARSEVSSSAKSETSSTTNSTASSLSS